MGRGWGGRGRRRELEGRRMGIEPLALLEGLNQVPKILLHVAAAPGDVLVRVGCRLPTLETLMKEEKDWVVP